MIERTNQKQKLVNGPNGVFLHPREFNFPRASLLEYTFRFLARGGYETTTDLVSGVRLTFGVGNPPDYGLGSTQTQTIAMPTYKLPFTEWEQDKQVIEAEIVQAEAERTNAETLLGTEGTSGSGLLQIYAIAETVYIKASEAEKQTTAATALVEARNAVANQRDLISTLNAAVIKLSDALSRLPEPTGWTDPVTASFSRAFDALRIEVLAGEQEISGGTLEWEDTIEISRPEDIGPTYTAPITTAQGG
jgi:hypothetical protein